MTDAQWAAVRPLLPVPGWLEGRGGQPEAYCHRAMLDAIHYLVDNGTKWRAMPAEVIPVVWTHLTMDLVDPGRCRPCGKALEVQCGVPVRRDRVVAGFGRPADVQGRRGRSERQPRDTADLGA
ncbi:transposase [Streptomyces sp. NPDC099050]|uniref:transposase n=1 Tax=Streptomyces sp. NPDC099050 TaxID=3366100 RepID=UPI0037F28200